MCTLLGPMLQSSTKPPPTHPSKKPYNVKEHPSAEWLAISLRGSGIYARPFGLSNPLVTIF